MLNMLAICGDGYGKAWHQHFNSLCLGYAAYALSVIMAKATLGPTVIGPFHTIFQHGNSET